MNIYQCNFLKAEFKAKRPDTKSIFYFLMLKTTEVYKMLRGLHAEKAKVSYSLRLLSAMDSNAQLPDYYFLSFIDKLTLSNRVKIVTI